MRVCACACACAARSLYVVKTTNIHVMTVDSNFGLECNSISISQEKNDLHLAYKQKNR